MNRTKYVISLLLIGMLLLGYVGRVEAGQAPAATFYGTIKFASGDPRALDPDNLTESDVITAYVEGATVLPWEAPIIDDSNDNVLDYTIDVDSDEISTEVAKEGGVSGDDVTLMIGTRVVAIGAWESGTILFDIHPPYITTEDTLPVVMSKNSTPTAFSLTLTATDADLEDTFTWSIDTQGTKGVASIPDPGTGSTVNVGYIPNPGYFGNDAFQVKVTDSQGGEDIITVNVAIQDTVTLTVTKNLLLGSTVTVTSEPIGIDCGTTCSALFNIDSIVKLTATPDSGSLFVEWKEDGTFLSNTNPIDITMDKTKEITATFTKEMWTISGYVLVGVTTPLQYVTLTYGESLSVQTDATGFYSFLVPSGWTGSVTPSLAGYLFSPVNYTYTTPIAANLPDQNFTATQIVHSIDLEVGWNLVSFNVVPLDKDGDLDIDIEDVLFDIDGNYNLVYAWDASVSSDYWKKYDPSQTEGNSLTNLNETQGFWIRMTAADTLDVYGSAYPTSTAITLSTAAGGWNLVGFPAKVAATMPTPLSDIATSYSLVYGYRATDATDPWELYDPAAPAYVNDMIEMVPGMGYWIKVTEAATWTVPY